MSPLPGFDVIATMSPMSRLPDALREHLVTPRNVGEPRGGFSHRGEALNGACRDHLVIYVDGDEQGRVARAGFRAKGCPAAMAMGSAVTDLLVGLPLDGTLAQLAAARLAEAYGEPAPLHRHALALVTEALDGLSVASPCS